MFVTVTVSSTATELDSAINDTYELEIQENKGKFLPDNEKNEYRL